MSDSSSLVTRGGDLNFLAAAYHSVHSSGQDVLNVQYVVHPLNFGVCSKLCKENTNLPRPIHQLLKKKTRRKLFSMGKKRFKSAIK